MRLKKTLRCAGFYKLLKYQDVCARGEAGGFFPDNLQLYLMVFLKAKNRPETGNFLQKPACSALRETPLTTFTLTIAPPPTAFAES
jgi:hypothetical protein